MSNKVEVTDPYTGVTVRVMEGSPQAKAWAAPSVGEKEPKPAPVKRSPRPRKAASSKE